MNNVHEFPEREAKSGMGYEQILDEARSWVLRFNSDTPASEEDIKALREWVASSPAHRQALEEAEAFWCEAEMLSELAVPMSAPRAQAGYFSQLWYRLSGAGAAMLNRSGAVAAFAFVLISLTLASLYMPFYGTVGNGVYSTAVGEQRVLAMRDGSQVQLDTNSEVRIAYEDGVRVIYLMRGKAHFDVAKAPDRPFEVFAGAGLVRAVGTAFSVYLAENNVEVLVDEGKVDLARVLEDATDLPGVESVKIESALAVSGESETGDNRPEQVVPVDAIEVSSRALVGEVFLSLEVGQAASFDNQEQALVELSQKELQNAQAWRNGTLVFVRDPLSDVVYEVSRYTDITIEITDPKLKHLVMGGRFKAGDLDALLEVLEIGFGVKVVYLNEQHIQLRLAANE